MTQKTYDVIIIGAGIIGLACAYELSQAGATVCIVEKHLPGAGQSTKTGGGIRLAHNSKINVALTQMSLPVWNSFESLFGIDPRYREFVHLFMSSEQKIKQTFENQLKWHSDFNCPSIILDANQLRSLAISNHSFALLSGNRYTALFLKWYQFLFLKKVSPPVAKKMMFL